MSALVEEEVNRGNSSAALNRLNLIEDIPRLSLSDEATNIAELLLPKAAVSRSPEVKVM